MRSTTGIASVVAVLLMPALVQVAQAAQAGDGVSDFIGGLEAMADGKFQKAADLLGKAAGAKPDAAVRQLDWGIALMLSGQGNAARDALAQAAKLEPQRADAKAWSQAREIVFDRVTPEIPPPSKDVPYAAKLMLGALGTLSPKEDQRARATTAIEEVARDLAREQRNGLEAVKAFYGGGRYREALEVIDAARAKQLAPAGAYLAYAGHCKLGLGEHGAAREAYTLAIRVLPPDAGCLVGRARCEISLGALDAAQEDLALARRAGGEAAAAVLAEAAQLLSKAKADGGKPGPRSIRREEYTRERCRLQLDVRDRATKVEPLLALSRFYLEPVASCDVTLGGVLQNARVPCGKMDVPRADEMLARAVKLAPDDPSVILQQARLEAVRSLPEQMMKTADRALVGGAIDLEMAVLYLQYDVRESKRAAAEAERIRNTPSGNRKELDDDGKFRMKYFGPSADDFARARDLEQRAKALRDNAPRALEVLRKKVGDGADPASQATRRLIEAYDAFRAGNMEAATRAAQQALAIDPVNVHALRFLISAYGMTKSPLAKQYRAILDEVDHE